MTSENTGRSAKRYVIGALVAVIVVLGIRGYFSYQYNKKCNVPRGSCQEHLQAGCTANSVYPIATAAGAPIKAYCDQTTDHGGWMLVLNYNHKGATNPNLQIRKTDLPLSDESAMGTDQSGTPNWGHASNDMLSRFEFSELRFRCGVANVDRLLDFKTSSKACISYFKTGKGDCLSVNSEFAPLPGHTAKLPRVATGGFNNRGDFAMTEFPFFLAMRHHWGIHGLEHRWECDDYSNGEGLNSIHQIFVR